MGMWIFICVVIVLQWNVSYSISISDEISEDITFIHRTFAAPPSLQAMIKVDVSYPESSVLQQNNNPIMGIYTSNNHVNIKKKCEQFRWGQLKNDILQSRIRLDKSDIRPRFLKCLLEGKDTIQCTGNITIQDFKPRNFSFSFGFSCDGRISYSSLKGLTYNMSILEQSNETNCAYLPSVVRESCEYPFGSLPNLIGGEDMVTILWYWGQFNLYVDLFDGHFYQHFLEIGCHVTVPKCDPASRQVINPCREMCRDLKKALVEVTIPGSIINGKTPHASSDDKVYDVDSLEFDCDYLPSLGGDVPCFYKPVTCGTPPSVKNAAMLNISENQQQLLCFGYSRIFLQ